MSMNRSAYRFSLMEVLVALAVLGVAGTVIVQVMSHSLDINRDACKYSTATLLAREKIETVLAADDPSAVSQTGEGEGRYKGLKWRLTVKPVQDQQRELRRVSVAVFWQTPRKRQRRIALHTVVGSSAAATEPASGAELHKD